MNPKKSKKILFITFDLSGYYDCIRSELENNYGEVDYYNLEDYKNLPYKGILQRIKSFYYKKFKKLKLKNYYKYQPLIKEIANSKYDIALIVRPDLFFDSQLEVIRQNCETLIAYYHDSINNIPRKKDVIHFFDKVYSYEKRDVKKYNLKFITNFIYLENQEKTTVSTPSFFTVMSKDYRFNSLMKLAVYLKHKKFHCELLVHTDKNQPKNDYIDFINERKNNAQVLEYIKNHSTIVDIHKYGIQDGLTFRVFESIYFEKKMITSNRDIRTYDFYNPNNIFVIDDFDDINIPESFYQTPYEKIPTKIYEKYQYSNWVKTILKIE